jgi:hypothetical protein
MSFFKLLPLVLVGAVAVGVPSAPARAQNIGSGIVIDDVDLVNPQLVNGVLTAAQGTVEGTIAGLPFTTQLRNFRLDLDPDVPAGSGNCVILDLELAPIDLALLGLHVNTSPICLGITAIEGGGILGDLLCGLAGPDGLLDLDGVLSDVLGAVLTDALGEAGDPPAGAEDICEGECEVLDLAVGPVDLTLLGLNVHLDDCDNGPVQVCLSANEGEGLLGDLLCGLAGGGVLPDLGALEDLLGAVNDILDLDLTNKQLDKLVNLVGRLLGDDGVLSDKELDKIDQRVDKLLRKAA